MPDPIRCAYDLTEGPVVDLPAPCPFCGGTAGTVGRLDWPERTRWAVACASCGAEGPPEHSEASALGAWGRRACGESEERDAEERWQRGVEPERVDCPALDCEGGMVRVGTPLEGVCLRCGGDGMIDREGR